MRNHSHNFAHFFPSWSRPELVVRASPIRAKYRFITDGCTAVDDAANHAGNCQHACQNGTGSPSAIVDYRRMRFCELKTVQQHRWWVMDRCYWYINDGDNDGGDDDDRMWIGFHIWYDIDVTSSSHDGCHDSLSWIRFDFRKREKHQSNIFSTMFHFRGCGSRWRTP